jgi:type III secretory pathway component EscS
MKQEIENTIAEHEKRLDELFFQLGDVLDVKASIILVVITFLGAISGQVLALRDLPYLIKIIQIVAVLALSEGVVASVISLWPREFYAPPDAAEWVAYLQELEKYFHDKEDGPERVTKEFEQAITQLRRERTAKNRALTRTKSAFNSWAFRGVVIAAVAEASCLIWMAFWHM